jgi:putative oxidoreductase
MSIIFHIGRILFVAIFVWSGFGKLMDIAGTAQTIAAKVPIPAVLAGLTAQLESTLGMPTPQLLAIVAGVVELVSALLIVFNFGTRWAALVLLLFTAATTVFFHDFWNMTGADRSGNMVQAFKNVSMIGGLLMLFVLGAWRPAAPPRY